MFEVSLLRSNLMYRNLCLIALMLSTAAFAAPMETCSFIDANAFKNQARCTYTDPNKQTVMITPNKRISIKVAAEWMVSASAFLHLGGEKSFVNMVIFTSPDRSGDTVEAYSSAEFHFQDDVKTIRSSTIVCKHAKDWSEVVGKDGTPAAKLNCSPLSK